MSVSHRFTFGGNLSHAKTFIRINRILIFYFLAKKLSDVSVYSYLHIWVCNATGLDGWPTMEVETRERRVVHAPSQAAGPRGRASQVPQMHVGHVGILPPSGRC